MTLGWPSALSWCFSCNFYCLNFHPINSPGQFLTHSSKHELFLGTNLVTDAASHVFLAASCAPFLATSYSTHGCGSSLPEIISIFYVVKTQQAKSRTMFVGAFITHMPRKQTENHKFKTIKFYFYKFTTNFPSSFFSVDFLLYFYQNEYKHFKEDNLPGVYFFCYLHPFPNEVCSIVNNNTHHWLAMPSISSSS